MSDKKRDAEDRLKPPHDPAGEDFLPPLDFSSIVLPIFTQALLKLGLLGEPDQREAGLNLTLARRLIDILDLLKDRTKGNLASEEEAFLDSCLHQLKAAYLEKARSTAG